MKKKKITKTYPVTRQATHTLFPSTNTYLPAFVGLCEDGRRGRRQKLDINHYFFKRKTHFFSSATYVVPTQSVTFVSLS